VAVFDEKLKIVLVGVVENKIKIVGASRCIDATNKNSGYYIKTRKIRIANSGCD
jgi:hypothetical protein